MWQTIVLGGLMAGNGLPRFIRGITRRRYPSALGHGPVPNLIAGWAGLVLGGLLLWWAHIDRHPELSFASVGASVLLIGLFHAGPGAFGRRDAHQ
ncbi:hypothetical protein ACIBF6_36350 [Streptosporangium amethystogenes]|uniref:hypothetical protein n=1 Tax=Streptosporangium amethystogenes TaxID=2002 RepID=UPI003798A6DC